MALQGVSLSTGPAQTAAVSSGTASSAPASADAAFLLLMQTLSQQATPQGKTEAKGTAEAEGGTQAALLKNTDTDDAKTSALPYGAAALAALLAVQAARKNPASVQQTSETTQSRIEAVTDKTAEAEQTQTLPASSPQIVPAAESAALLQSAAAQRNPTDEPKTVTASSTDTQPKVQALSGTAQALTAAIRQTQGSQTVSAQPDSQPTDPRQSVFAGQTAQTVSLGEASSEAFQQFSQQDRQISQTEETPETAVLRQTGSALPGGQTLPRTPQDDSSDMTVRVQIPQTEVSAQSKVQTADGTAESGTTVQTQDKTPQTSPKIFLVGSENSSRGNQQAPTADSTGVAASTIANLYSDGKVVVKVSDQAQQMRASPSGQIADAVSEGLKTGTKQLQVDLYPDSLGRVSVKLTSKDGVLTVQLAADNTKTQDLIASSSGDIRSMLQNATGQSVQVVRPDPTAAQQWYAQDGGFSGQDGQQQRENNRQKKNEEQGSLDHVGAISTEDFLSIMRRTASV